MTLEAVVADMDNPVIQGLQSLLLKYGRHIGPCAEGIICYCGWTELRDDLEAVCGE